MPRESKLAYIKMLSEFRHLKEELRRRKKINHKMKSGGKKKS